MTKKTQAIHFKSIGIYRFSQTEPGFNSRKGWLLSLAKARNRDFEISTLYPVIYITLVKIIFCGYNKAALAVNVFTFVTIFVAAVQACHRTSM